MKIYMHVNYLEHMFSIEEITARAALAGYDGVELRGWDVTGQLPLEEYLCRCGEAARINKLDLVFGCPNETVPECSQDSMQRLKTVIRMAARYGAKILNVFSDGIKGEGTPYHHFEQNGSSLATDEDFARTAVYFRQAAEDAAEYGIDLCFEIHNCYLHDMATPTVKLLKQVARENVKANFDYGNIFLNRNNLGLDRELAILSSRIGYAHIKNVVAYNHYESRLLRGAPLGEGDINIYMLMQKLLATGFKGPLAIENILLGDKRRYVDEDLNYLRLIIDELTGVH